MANIIVNIEDAESNVTDVADPLEIPEVTIENLDKVTVNGRLGTAEPNIVSCIISRLTGEGLTPVVTTRFSEAKIPVGGDYAEWSLELVDPVPGIYLVIASAPGEEIGGVKLKLGRSPKTAAISNVVKNSAFITVSGTVVNPGAIVTCTLARISGSPSKTKVVTASIQGQWAVGFTPAELGAQQFQGLYSFEASVPTEGTASTPIQV